MKNKIAVKLTMFFATTLLLFSIIIGSVFMTLFQDYTIELHKADLEKRAVAIATTLSEYISNPSPGMGMMGGKQGGYGGYLRFLDQIAMTDVWIVDENLKLIMDNRMNQQYNYADLPEDAESVVKSVFEGNTTFSKGFSDLLNTPTLTVGTPMLYNGKVIGALLLHSQVEGMNEAIAQGFYILAISVIVALAISILLAILFAITFTKSLKHMKDTALQLADGNYTAKTEIHLNDEIGELANVMDILSERLDIARGESEQLLKLRRDFVANISHELRTPVTVIRGSLEALCDEVVTDPEQVKSYHRQMLQESIFLQRLVNDLLDLSRLQNTDFQMEMQEVNLCDVIQDVVRSARNLAQAKNVIIEQQQDTQVFMIHGDYGRLRQMLFIVLDNAIKFSLEGGVVFVIVKDKILSIVDNGVGIAAEDLPYIFDRFYKAKSEQNKYGTGLGLAIAKQIAERHSIQVSVSSVQNESAEFKFQF